MIGPLLGGLLALCCTILFARQLSLDFWDFSSDDPLTKNVHAKATARLRFLTYLYVQGGYDNPFNRQLDTAFVGGGLTFDDDDLKYLIGSGMLKR